MKNRGIYIHRCTDGRYAVKLGEFIVRIERRYGVYLEDGRLVSFVRYFYRARRFKTLEGALCHASMLFDMHPYVDDAVMVIG